MLPIFFIHKNPNFFCMIRVKFNSFFLSNKPIIFIMLDNVKPFSCGFFLFPVAGEGDSSYGIDKKESIRACESIPIRMLKVVYAKF